MRVSWLVVLLACGHSAPVARELPVTARLDGPRTPWVAELQARGARVLASGEATFVERTGETLRLPDGRGCRALVVRAGGGLRDVDAALYDANGVLVALDDAPDAHAAVTTCTSGVAFGRIDAHAGAGTLTWVVLEEMPEGLLAELGIRGGRAASDDAWARLDAVLRARGFDLRSERWRTLADPRLPLTSPFELEPGRCVTLGARAQGQDVGARLVLDGASVEADPGSVALLQVCSGAAPLRGRLEVVVPAAAEVSFARWEGREPDVGGDEALWLGRRTP